MVHDPHGRFFVSALVFATSLLFALTAWVPSVLLLRWLLF
jgi:hypothetical protein